MSDAAPKSQDELRNLFFKRPANDAGLPPPKAAEPLPPPRSAGGASAAAGGAAAPAADGELDEDQIEDALFGDVLPAAKEISAEEARKNAQMVTSNKHSLVKDHAPLPPGWVQRVSKKKSKGKVYYVNLRTKKFQRERPVADHIEAHVEAEAPPAKKQKTKPKVTNVSEALVRLGVVMKKEEKFAKATTMFLQLLENNMSEGNSGEFLKVFEAAMARRTWIHATDKRPTYVKLIEAAVKRREMFGEPAQWLMQLWEFDVLTHSSAPPAPCRFCPTPRRAAGLKPAVGLRRIIHGRQLRLRHRRQCCAVRYRTRTLRPCGAAHPPGRLAAVQNAGSLGGRDDGCAVDHRCQVQVRLGESAVREGDCQGVRDAVRAGGREQSAGGAMAAHDRAAQALREGLKNRHFLFIQNTVRYTLGQPCLQKLGETRHQSATFAPLGGGDRLARGFAFFFLFNAFQNRLPDDRRAANRRV